MNTDDIKYLIEKYNDQTATSDERMIVEQWYDRINGAELTKNQFNEEKVKKQIFQNITSRIDHNKVQQEPKKIKLFYTLFFKAAIMIMVLLAGVYVYLKQTERDLLVTSSESKKTKIIPGGNNAVLLLADGSQIILNKASDGQIADQPGVKVVKTKSGELIYRFAENTNPESIAINTVITPRGGQYHLVLVDGTEVWLNAGSSIKFPTAFTGSDRRVDITGEVYFEVAKNKAKPFIVSTNKSEITVLGTHFNINAYDDEEYQRTTLLEGSVEIKSGKQTTRLTPGQQAIIKEKTEGIKIEKIEDLEAIIAWKNGYFQFEKADLKSVMRLVSRWYDIKVSYSGSIPAKEYTGKIPRNVSVSKLIEMLAYTGIHCRVEDNRIIVNQK
ncbi:transmembrane sensor [Flavobacterium sp. W4I14]|nr:transmembrane sensor [Flavobacterium sp. W4I14]